MGPSLVSPVHDPRSLSPYGPRSRLTFAHFCGRPTASSYDGFTGAPHAAYIHHDVERDRYVVRTFGRGGMRVDERRRSGVGRSTYEAFCAAPRSVQRNTPLAPSPWLDGEANWQLGDANAAPRRAISGAFNFTVRPVAVPHAAAEAAAAVGEPAPTTGSNSRSADADFTKADQGLRTHYRRYTRKELLQRHAHLDFIYSYVNGSDIIRSYTKPFAKTWECWNIIASVQLLWGEMQRAADIGADAPHIAEEDFSRHIAELLFVSSSSPCALSKLLSDVGGGKDAMKRVEASLWWAATHPSHSEHLEGAVPPAEMALTNAELLRVLGADLEKVKPDEIDADCDELRHSMRGLLRHTRSWHRGRMIVVTPYGNVPLWLNQSRNFFMRSLYAAATASPADAEAAGGAAHSDDARVLGTAEARFVREVHTGKLHYTRIHVVDQRALMPPAPLTTVNSYIVEPFVYRLRNASSVFIYMNDDYLIMKDVDITDFVNEFGGPLLRIRKSDSMEYFESNLDYFRRGLVFNTMLMHRDLDRTPADLEELVQPAAASASLTSTGGDAAVMQRGFVRASWAAFAAAVDARSSVAAPEGSAQATSTACTSNHSAAVCAWAECAWGAADGTLARGACAMPRVSAEGEPPWSADAAGTFALVPPPPAASESGEWTWAGQAQMPALMHWGRRVLERVTADLIAPRYYLQTTTIVLRDDDIEPMPPRFTLTNIADHVVALAELLEQLGNETTQITPVHDKAMHLLSTFMGNLANHQFPTHRILKTQPRLRKYRMRLDSHAPYPQCRNMWGYIHKRYAPDLNLNMFIERKRTTMDLLPPSTHTAHMLRHPWAASSQYLPYLMAKQAWRMQRGAGLSPLGNTTPVFPVVDVALDNEDGCAPATYITEAEQSARYHEFRDDVRWNERAMKAIRSYRGVKPFTNINSKFSSNIIGETLRKFLEELYPTPILLEENWRALNRKKILKTLRVSRSLEKDSSGSIEFSHLDVNFNRLMHLPLILVSNDEEGFCPLLRSLRHVLPDFRGRRIVHVLVPPADGVSLTTPVFPVVDVALDNEDGCAPATYITEAEQSARYHEFLDDEELNEETMDKIRSYRGVKPFTNINSKFSSNIIGETLRKFLEELYPTPILLEENWRSAPEDESGTDELRMSLNTEENSEPHLEFSHLDVNFNRLMHLPLILVSNDEEGFCPLLRSLRHVLPDFRGRRIAHLLVPPADGVSLRAARADRRHAYRDFLPVARCSLSAEQLRRVTLPANSSVADVVVAGLRLAREDMEVRQWEAPALVELRGQRVALRAVQALMLDARTLHDGARGFTELSLALAVPAELLAHEDFADHLLDGAAQSLVRLPTAAEAATVAAATVVESLGKAEKRNKASPDDFAASVLVLSEADAGVRHTHWAHGASEHDLLSAMPLPYDKMEDMEENVQWGF
ncbi:hypothetical protein LSCM4_05329 [Leishmania orientalis]|uniref:Stealth protein CR3 conserved region 3 domain-containing protein n=1 Tax=Leishmania orientalis TaxID=2249476 RepID=A0A836KKR7_9TRYP|nr:hypothetical protein LSCM4_05329 [Leishmania orientalis]